MNDMSGTPREDLLDAQTSAGPSISAARAPAKKAPSQAYANITEREKAYEDFWKALRELLGENLFVPDQKLSKLHQHCAKAVLNNTTFEIYRIPEDNTPYVVVLTDPVREKSIGILQDRVAYQSRNPKKDFTMEDAMKMAWLAVQNKDLLEKGVTLEGSAKHKRMLQLAIQAVNETMPTEQRLEIKNPVHTYLMAKPDFRAFVAANSGDAPAQAAPEQAQASPEAAAPAPAAPTADAKAPMAQNMAEATVTAQPYFFNTSSIDAIAAGIEQALEAEGYNKSTSKDRKVDKTGAFPFYTVYKVPMELDETSSGAAYYVMKNKKPHLIGLDLNGQSVMRDAEIFMQKDINHPKNLAQAQEKSPVAFSLSDIVNASVDQNTYNGEFPATPAPAPKAPSGVERLAAKMMAKAADGQEIPRKTKPLMLGQSEGTRRLDPSPS